MHRSSLRRTPPHASACGLVDHFLVTHFHLQTRWPPTRPSMPLVLPFDICSCEFYSLLSSTTLTLCSFCPSPIICHCVVILSTYIDPMVTPGNCFVDSKIYLIIFSSMAVKGSSSPPSRVILMPNKNKEYLHLT